MPGNALCLYLIYALGSIYVEVILDGEMPIGYVVHGIPSSRKRVQLRLEIEIQ